MSKAILKDLENAGIFLDKNSDNERIVGAIEEIGECSDDDWDSLSKETQVWYHTCFGMLPVDGDDDLDVPDLPLPETFDLYAEELDWEDLDEGDLIKMTGKGRSFVGTVADFNEQYVAIISDDSTVSLDNNDIDSIFLVDPKAAPAKKEKPKAKPEKKKAPVSEKKKAPEKKKGDIPSSKQPPKKKAPKKVNSGRTLKGSALVRQAIVDDPEITKEELVCMLEDSEIMLSPTTLNNTIYGTKDTIKMAKEMGKWAE